MKKPNNENTCDKDEDSDECPLTRDQQVRQRSDDKPDTATLTERLKSRTDPNPKGEEYVFMDGFKLSLLKHHMTSIFRAESLHSLRE